VVLDPEDAKESLLATIEWTEHELREFLRDILSTYVTNKMTFDPYTISIDLRKVIIIAVLAVDGPQQPEAFQLIKKSLEGRNVTVVYDNNSTERMLRLVFEGSRFKSIQSDAGDDDPSSWPRSAPSPGPSC
jgi:hypothetical protein